MTELTNSILHPLSGETKSVKTTKKIRTGTFIAAWSSLAIGGLKAETEVSGNVSGVWTTEGSPYILIDDAAVPDDDTLVIDPGVEVRFGENLTLTVNGYLAATGTEEDTIRFHTDSDSLFGSLTIQEGGDTIRFTYCRFDSLEYAIRSSDRSLSIEHCLFIDNHNIRIEGGSVFINYCSFYNSLEGLRHIYIGYPNGEGVVSATILENSAFRSHMVVTEAEMALMERNVSFNHRNPNVEPRFSSVAFT